MNDGMGLAMLLIVLAYAGLFVGVVLLLRWALRLMRSMGESAGGRWSPWSMPTSAREALDQRYGRGEISREEYLQARRDLEEQT